MSEKNVTSAQKRNVREYNKHWWWLKKLRIQLNVAKYKYETEQKRFDELDTEFRYLTNEYINEVITKEEYVKQKHMYKLNRGNAKMYSTIWKERVEYIEKMVEVEEQLLEKASKYKGVKPHDKHK